MTSRNAYQKGNQVTPSSSKKENIKIPIKLHWIISYFFIRTPTQKELEELKLISIMSENEWNPHSTSFQEMENSLEENIEESISCSGHVLLASNYFWNPYSMHHNSSDIVR
jgi:hypothetical protein